MSEQPTASRRRAGAEQSLMSRMASKAMPAMRSRAFPWAWIEAGEDRHRLEVVAKKRRSTDGPRPDLLLARSWRRATTEVGGRPLHLLTPRSGSTGRVLFYCHGGAFVVGPSSAEWLFATKLADRAGFDLALYDYPKVPEHDGSVIQRTTLEALRLIEQRYPMDRLAIGGTSAGGGLAVSTMLRLQEQGRAQPLASVLFSPWLDLTIAHPDAAPLASTDKLLNLAVLRRDGVLYAGDRDPTDPLFSPRFATDDQLASLPPTVVTAGAAEVLLPEAEEFVARLAAAEVEATLFVEAFGQHVGVLFSSREGSNTLAQATAALRRMTEGRREPRIGG